MRPSSRIAISLVAMVCLFCMWGCDGFWVDTSSSDDGTTSGNYVYVANAGSSTISGAQISTAGALTVVSGSPYSVSYTPTSLAVSTSNKYLYVGTAAGIYGYTIGSSGQLTTISSGALLSGTINTVWMDVSPDGKWLISLNGDSSSSLITPSVNVFQINSGGTLTGTTSYLLSSITSAALPHEIHITPNGKFLFATLATGGTARLSFTTSTGAVAAAGTGLLSPVNSLTSDISLAIDAAGTYLYMARTGSSPGLSVYQISSSGGLTKVGSTYTTGSRPYSVAIGADGANVYVANYNDSTISGYVVGSSGVLTAATDSPFDAGSGVIALAADSTDKWLLAANYNGSPDMQSFSYDSAGGVASVSSLSSGTYPSAIAVTH